MNQTGSILVLGPQRPSPNLAASLLEAGARGPVAIISAGWRHDEGEIDALRGHLPFQAIHLPLYRWFDEAMTAAPELATAYRARQERIRAFKSLYRVRIAAAFAALVRMHRRPVPEADLYVAELFDAVRVLRDLDDRAVQVLEGIRAAAGDESWDHPVVARRRAEIAQVLEQVGTVAIAGGHVAVLMNRMHLFGLHRMLPELLQRGGTIAAWSAGAMALSERVVLFYDDPPEGPAEPEVLDRGFGLLKGRTLFPHSRRRLRLDDPDRLRLLQARFGTCLGLEHGACLHVRGEEWTDRSEPGSLILLAPPDPGEQP